MYFLEICLVIKALLYCGRSTFNTPIIRVQTVPQTIILVKNKTLNYLYLYMMRILREDNPVST